MPLDPSPPPPSPGWWRTAAAAGRLLLPDPCLVCAAPIETPPRDRERSAPTLGLCVRCRGRARRPRAGCDRCGAPLERPRRDRPAPGPHPPPGELCGACRRRAVRELDRGAPPVGPLVAAWSYEAPLDRVIAALKFRRREALAEDLAATMADAFRAADGLGGGPGDGPGDGPGEGEGMPTGPLLVPVPLHWWRRWQRGFDQAELLARATARHLGADWQPLLRRRRATRSQARLERWARRRNPRGAFALRRPFRTARGRAPLAGRHLVLIDDVATTGATLEACARSLAATGAARISFLVAARTPLSGGPAPPPRHLLS